MRLTELYTKVTAPVRDAYERALVNRARDNEWRLFTTTTTLTELHDKISRDLEAPMEEIRQRIKTNEATPAEWKLWADYRRHQLLYPTSAERKMSGN